MKIYIDYSGKVIVLMHDVKQTLPIVPGGDQRDIIEASLFSSEHWRRFQRQILHENMRLQRIADPVEQAQQTAYDQMLRGIGENREVQDLFIATDIPEGAEAMESKKEFIFGAVPTDNIFNFTAQTHLHTAMDGPEVDDFIFEEYKLFLPWDPTARPDHVAIKPPRTPLHLLPPDMEQVERALTFLYPPHGVTTPELAAKNVILATTNKIVDDWNDLIGARNTNQEHVLKSTDSFTDVDDRHGYLAEMVSETVLNRYNVNDVPRHELM